MRTNSRVLDSQYWMSVLWNAHSVLEPDSCSVPLAALFYDNEALAIVHNSFFETCRQEIRVLVQTEIPLDWSWNIALDCLRSGQGIIFFKKNNIFVFLKTRRGGGRGSYEKNNVVVFFFSQKLLGKFFLRIWSYTLMLFGAIILIISMNLNIRVQR